MIGHISYSRAPLADYFCDMPYEIKGADKTFKDKKQPAESAGYIWQRDYDSTDDENIWDRIGSLFGSERGSSSRSNNHSVSSGDYCEHAMHTNCV